jgi:hypothetical protein
LSATTAPEWDLLIGTGQLEVLDAEDGLNLAREADDELMRLASAYMLYLRSEWLALREALSAERPRQVGQLDEALLWLAVVHGRERGGLLARRGLRHEPGTVRSERRTSASAALGY